MRFKLLQKFKSTKNKDPQKLSDQLFKLHIEKRQAYIEKLYKSDNGADTLLTLRQHLEDTKKTIEANLYQIKSFYITQTLVEIYDFSHADAINWSEVSDGEKLIQKLPELPEVEFMDGTNPSQVQRLKATFKAQVQQVDDLNLQIRHISHALNLISNIAPTVVKVAEDTEQTVSLH